MITPKFFNPIMTYEPDEEFNSYCKEHAPWHWQEKPKKVKEQRMVIGPTTAKEIVKIIQRYLNKYGNITICELLDKFETNCLILN